jgi:hypothetical protein
MQTFALQRRVIKLFARQETVTNVSRGRDIGIQYIFFDVSLTVHLSIFISVINQHDAQNYLNAVFFISRNQ